MNRTSWVHFKGLKDRITFENANRYIDILPQIRESIELSIPKQPIQIFNNNPNNENVQATNLEDPIDAEHPLPERIFVRLGKVRIFETATGDDEPIHNFGAGATWDIIKETLHLSKGCLIDRNDHTKTTVIPPYPPGDYQLINSKSIIGIIL
ncbi:hypothetical protein DLAC_04204 [Tieghemostelium lacteum]|uniref:Uncharacterized protein n=1 Tax=Tieghemostelium lacteum TaxID=361077 RepID=A0A151ZS91_TIELA|nr:hypothetical protein DLAC_04204 [Tieghemostelium lacteum]|eukprot:KYQ96891.1 hypothetical protein DLAC_04204 [Tieghemostelium lacteum]